ncbi:hypothetical protein BDV93DRAFT_547741 [Ceratobasidium sp. AG-I]|nr:hypothetical protein BDV93DRAFT_547741 [Ceratobasidium sp. AG-I]
MREAHARVEPGRRDARRTRGSGGLRLTQVSTAKQGGGRERKERKLVRSPRWRLWTRATRASNCQLTDSRKQGLSARRCDLLAKSSFEELFTIAKFLPDITARALNNGYIPVCSHNRNTSHLLAYRPPPLSLFSPPDLYACSAALKSLNRQPSSTLGILRLRFSDWYLLNLFGPQLRRLLAGDLRFNVVIERPLFVV